MDPNKEKELVNLLDQYDAKGVKFAQAKKELLAKGYTEAEIVYGLYSAPFDGEINGPRPENPMTKFYKANPEKADKLAKTLLLNDLLIDSDRSIAYTGAAGAGVDTQSRLYYESRAADELGIPYFTLFFLGIALSIGAAIAVIKFRLSAHTSHLISDIISVTLSLSISSLYGYKILKKRRAIKKLRKEVRGENKE